MPEGVYCIFREGNWGDFSDTLQLIYSLGVRECHAEVLVNDTAFTAQSIMKDAVFKREMPGMFTYDDIEWLKLPIKDAHKAIDFLEEACKTHAKFGIPVLDFLFPELVVDMVDVDHKDECMHPDAWKQLYCSKFVLFFLRYSHKTGNLIVDDASMEPLWRVNSNRCSPVMLRKLVTTAFSSASMHMM
jgi:hypothetical protein